MYLKMFSDLSRLALWPILMKFYEKTMSEMLNTKTQNIFCCVNENDFFNQFEQGYKKTGGEKKSFLF